ncbi:MAG: hypothetical protein IK036_04430 [Clostridia bacterium]|nr:hypothetical protein [Clostridia bacterium]MBR5976406.1 hypothetical protein [Clostridia bacterium]MBR5991984.1 hypothetical protein [Clostridia bacterium]MBR6512851.1 hypothetical protein [Clostridia bacterium]
MAEKKVKFGAFNIAVIVLAVLIVFCAIFAVSRIYQGYTEYTNGPDSILNCVKRQDYSYAIGEAYHDRALGKNGDDYKTPYAAVDYINAEVLYVAYTRVGDEEKAAGYKAEMERSYADMGQLAKTFAPQIDAMFE